MVEKFGNTWWGNAWLQSLSNIDYENRIPRGATYARNGSVVEIKVEGNVVKAKVRGRRPRPYHVVIVVPPFSADEVERLMTTLQKKPGIISKLLSRELSTDIVKIADECGLNIFPKRWSDLKMNCSCPDWAVPCKHLAAVVYVMSREIDNNPFLVFQMHGVDLIDELKKRGFTEIGNADEQSKVAVMKDLLHLSNQKDLQREESLHGHRLNFTHLSNRTEPLLLLLPNNPPFCPATNFKSIYSEEIRRVVKSVERFFTGKLLVETVFPVSVTVPDVQSESELSFTFDENMHWSVSDAAPTSLTAETLPQALLRLNTDFLPDYSASVIAAHQALFLALHLAGRGCIVPQVVQLSDKSYSVRWLPAYVDDEVKKLIEQLEEMMPAPLVGMLPIGKKRRKTIGEGRGEWLTSFFLGRIVDSLTANNRQQLPITRFFFHNEPQSFNGVGEREIAGGIKAWIDHLQLTDSDWRIVFNVSEKEENFNLHINVEDKREPQAASVPLEEVLQSPRYETERFKILRGFSLLSSLVGEVDEYINSGAKRPITFSRETFAPFLLNIIPTVQMLGIKVFLPRSLRTLLRPKPTLSISAKDDSNRATFGLFDFFDFDWKVALGDSVMTLDEFRKFHQKATGLIKFRQSYIYVSAEDLARLNKAFTEREALSPVKVFQTAILGEFDSAPVTFTNEAKLLMKKLTQQELVPQPRDIHATLRPYQERGYSWMYRNMRLGFGSILADDMGLGKTLQSITLMLKLKEEGQLLDKHIIVVAPTGLLTNWQAEIHRFAPTLTVGIYHGGARNLKDFSEEVMLTTYGVVRSDIAKLKKLAWRVVVIDEAQNIKNPATAQSKAIHAITADTHIALSGTPVENRLTEYWSIMDFANKGYLDTLKNFKTDYVQPIQLSGDEDCAARFRKITSPFMMRRMKTDKSIISDLPDKIEQNDYATLTAEQAALYQSTLDAAMAEIEGINTTDQESLFKRQGLILQMILALKQICNHPAQFLKNDDQRPELSGKALMLLDRVESIAVDSKEKVLVFTQFREMGDMLAEFVEQRTGRRPMFYHGGCSVKQRQEMVERFQTNRLDRVFILSLKAAGTGLNLTAASHVIHYDLWWNPAVEAQATDRAYRIGQKKNVVVHRFITQNTFEERIDDMIQQKKHLADMTVASGENWIGKLSNKELRDIFSR